ncbi:CRISPR-associated protein Cmr4 [Streptococcus sp. zg-86]|uniref:CRISPR-associated protein Cmr4 n=1 Tax=Streptococcus zhangguiae TaxID=2664091 RepID=A0A6I4RRD9_9STRE|nr:MULTISPECIES: RAMP superfamily CRISPR-associated protein [unclassified Streptococcus]MTB64581.1 CRISPR-associated protein Cmr4 [Streptococcus sp. zg-86]MTB90891.1 CRISPR-associated protein Cmr4 [Streptococcus sp. zg-36]MWV56685.1 CRISPR-associated protein Cmr4 [Streptococcus sp. zg-70]QTH48643.1 CRISPR-associated protein Cmr4 [Streptococcus sp. zg-86]
MKAKAYILECLTNLHVGNGEVNFNVIDNEIERDAVTNFPTINSSGVKGALREFFEHKKIDKDVIDTIFGSSDRETSQGQLKFLSANLLAQPLPETAGDKPYKLAVPQEAATQFQVLTETFLCTSSLFKDIEKNYNLQIVSNDEYEAHDLPVLARNCLNNGKSENLWYEEVVPHKTIFYLIVVSQYDNLELLNQFDQVVANQVVQFGANASIGYGLCKMTGL